MKSKISWKKLMKEIREANKDPEFKKGIKEFIALTTGKSPQ